MINVNFRVTGMYVGNVPAKEGHIRVQVNEMPTVLDIMRAV